MADFNQYYKDAQLQYRQGTGVDVIPSLPHLGVQSDADRANVLNLALANMEYDRNSVKNQIQQYIDAGLNPNLVYSKSEPAKYGAPTMQNDVTAQQNQRVNNILQAMSTVSGAVGMVGQFMKNVQSARLASQESWFNEQHIESMQRLRYMFRSDHVDNSMFDDLYPGSGLQQVANGLLYAPNGFPSGYESDFNSTWAPLGNNFYYNRGMLRNEFDFGTLKQLQQLFISPELTDSILGLRAGQITRQNLINNRLDYQNKMLDTLPPAARVIFGLFSELLGTISKFK